MNELIIEVMMNMTLNEILEKSKINKEWNEVISNDNFWCKLLKRDFNKSENLNKSDSYENNCKKIYQIKYKKDRIFLNDIEKYAKEYNIDKKFLIVLIEDSNLFIKENNNSYLLDRTLKPIYFENILETYPEVLDAIEVQQKIIDLYIVDYELNYESINIYRNNDKIENDDYDYDVQMSFEELITKKFPKIIFNDGIMQVNILDFIKNKNKNNLKKEFKKICDKLFDYYKTDVNKGEFINEIIKLYTNN